MTGVESWLVVLGFILIVAALVAIFTVIIEWFVQRLDTSQAQKDVDDLFRRDRARDIMRKWMEDES